MKKDDVKDYSDHDYSIYKKALLKYQNTADELYIKQLFEEYGIKMGSYIYNQFDIYFDLKKCIGGYALLMQVLPSKVLIKKIYNYYFGYNLPLNELRIEFGLSDGVKTYIDRQIKPQFYAITKEEYEKDMKKVLKLRKK